MKFSRNVEKPIWETNEDDLLEGDRGIVGYSEVRTVRPAEIVTTMNRIKTDAENPYKMLLDITAVDESQRQGRPAGEKHRYTLQYTMLRPETGETMLLKAPVEDSADEPTVPSIAGVFKCADWYERETYDMFGIKFDGHPNMRRILMPDWWKGWPLRKEHPNRATDMEPLVIRPEDLQEFEGFETFSSGDSAIRTKGENGEDLMILNLGPNHPGTHGVLRVVLTLSGEYMEKVYPVIGYHHRGAEKMAERQSFHTYIPYTDRIDYLGGVYNELPYVMACEKLAGINVPERAQVMRIMLGEIYRICSHLVWLGTFGHDVGAMTPVFYTFREREKLFKIIEMITGGRMHPNFLRIGGCSMDLPPGWREPILAFLKDFDKHLNEYFNLMFKNPIFKSRTIGVGVMNEADCWEWGVSGPNLRGAGSKFDVRKAMPYGGYEAFEFDIPSLPDGDCWSRGACRHAEMAQSARIIKQCIDMMPDGEYISRDNRYAFPPAKAETMMDIEALINHFLAVGWGLDLPAGESYQLVEQPKGMGSYHVISDGRNSPYRLRVRAPSFAHMQTLPALCEGGLLSDLLASLGAMDFVLADVDR